MLIGMRCNATVSSAIHSARVRSRYVFSVCANEREFSVLRLRLPDRGGGADVAWLTARLVGAPFVLARRKSVAVRDEFVQVWLKLMSQMRARAM